MPWAAVHAKPVAMVNGPTLPVWIVKGVVLVEDYESPRLPVGPVAPVGPSMPPYDKEFHEVAAATPTLNLLVSVSIPISPGARTVFAVAHCAAVPRRNWNWMFGMVCQSEGNLDTPAIEGGADNLV